MKKIPVGKLEAFVDDEDFVSLSSLNWHLGGSKGYATAFVGEKTIYMHRVILSATSNERVDHINGNALDNCSSNLRLCSQSQNLMNARPRKHSSKFKGVAWSANRKKWFVSIRKDGKTVPLGRFSDEPEAARAYDRAATCMFGEFAKTNAALGLL
jgi:hypothetical protein